MAGRLIARARLGDRRFGRAAGCIAVAVVMMIVVPIVMMMIVAIVVVAVVAIVTTIMVAMIVVMVVSHDRGGTHHEHDAGECRHREPACPEHRAPRPHKLDLHRV